MSSRVAMARSSSYSAPAGSARSPITNSTRCATSARNALAAARKVSVRPVSLSTRARDTSRKAVKTAAWASELMALSSVSTVSTSIAWNDDDRRNSILGVRVASNKMK